MKTNVKIAIVLAVAGIGVACVGENASPREIGQRAAELGVERYDVADDAVVMVGEHGDVIAAAYSDDPGVGSYSVVLESDDHRLQLDADAAGMRYSFDGTEIGSAVLGTDTIELTVTPEQFEHFELLLAVQEDVGVGAIVMGEDDGMMAYEKTECIKWRVCVGWPVIELFCVGHETCYPMPCT